MKPTKLSSLLKQLIIISWLFGVLFYVLREQFQYFIQVPLNLPIAILSLVVAIGSWTLLARNRISGPTKTFTPIQSARTAALALAGSHTGILLAGGSIGIAVSYLLASPTTANTDRIQVLSGTAVAALLLVVVSLWLERICIVPDQKDDN